MAFRGPGVPSNGIPRSRARGSGWVEAACAQITDREDRTMSTPGRVLRDRCALFIGENPQTGSGLAAPLFPRILREHANESQSYTFTRASVSSRVQRNLSL